MWIISVIVNLFSVFRMLVWWQEEYLARRNPGPAVHSHKPASLHFNGHFPGEPGLAGVYWSKWWWKWWWQLDYWSYKSCKAPVKSSPPTNQHPVFYRPDALPIAQPTVSKPWRENITFHGLAYPKLTWGLSTLSVTTNSSGLPWGGLPCLSSALWCQYPNPQPSLTCINSGIIGQSNTN